MILAKSLNTNFNSIKVRLELQAHLTTSCHWQYFNSIKVRLEPLPAYQPQDHYQDFNSIKVRLERARVSAVRLSASNFNSIKVRLELEAAGINPYLMLEFQFHKGTIRTSSSNQPTALQVNFNSIKVQLERLISLCERLNYVDFNSIKVRLELEIRAKQVCVAPFQFHKGTIRTTCRVRKGLPYRISIP